MSTLSGHDIAGPQLRLDRVGVLVGGCPLVADISFELKRGEIVGLIGIDGLARSAVLDAISGFVPAAGAIWFEGVQLIGRPAHQRTRLGIARGFHPPSPSAAATVRRVVAVAAAIAGGGGILAMLCGIERRELRQVVDDSLEKTGLTGLADHPVTGLSHSYLGLLETARALAARPRLVVLDRPVAGFSPGERKHYAQILLAVAADGISVLLAEDDVELVARVCERAIVLDNGRMIADASPSTLGDNADVLRSFSGVAP